MVPVVLFREKSGRVPYLEWVDTLPAEVRLLCRARLHQLSLDGHALRRPIADDLRNGIHELRLHRGRRQYRILYFFHGRGGSRRLSRHPEVRAAVPPTEIERSHSSPVGVRRRSDGPHSRGASMSTKKRKGTTDALEIMDRRYFSEVPDFKEKLEDAVLNMSIATEVYELRTRAKLTQKQLAERVGTTHTVISRLEDADYRGHSLKMLQRIVKAMGCRMEIHIIGHRRRRRIPA
ncbi:MAG: XRE family transcriptional regulator [Candidatus Eisenbacteria bacterium]|nr:XRE family transcriptional regulator [Candidatus Eisenbacteria bacterium]